MKVTNIFKLGVFAILLPASAFPGCACDLEPLSRTSVIEEATDRAIVDFGEVPVGLRVTKVFQITNDGDQPFSIERLALLPQTALFEVEHDLERIGPGEVTDLVIHFKPTEVVNYSAKLHVLYKDESGPLGELQIFGSGVEDTVCTSCEGTQAYCFDADTSVRYEHLGGCEEDQCLYEMVPAPCECGCDAESGECAACPEEEEPPVEDPAQCTFVREGYEQYEWLGCLPGQTCDLENRACLGNSLIGNLQDAIDYCENLEFAGHNDWVLPTIDQQKVLFTGCNGLPLNFPNDECGISHGCSYVGNEVDYSCGCEDDSSTSCLHQICASCEIGEGPGENGYYTAPGYFGMSANPHNCSSDFFTRTLRNVHSELTTVVTMRATTGYIQSGSHVTNNSRWTCVREVEPACGDGHIQAGEECDDGNEIQDDACDNECRRTL